MQQRQWLCNNYKKEGLVRNKGKGLDRSNKWSNPNIKFWFPHGNCVCVYKFTLQQEPLQREQPQQPQPWELLRPQLQPVQEP